MKFIKTFLQNMYAQAEFLNNQNIVQALQKTGPHTTLLDVGCWDGLNTRVWITAANVKYPLGIEPVRAAAVKSEKNGIKTFITKADSGKWPLKDNSVDCVVSNQVVEHLNDLDSFFAQAYRVLKPGGYIITSTNNLSSLHNIFALTMGWAPFDLTNSSYLRWGMGNPLATHRGESDKRGHTWTHKTIYTAHWLMEWQQAHGFISLEVYGAGFYPLPAILGRYITRYSAFITTVCQKKK